MKTTQYLKLEKRIALGERGGVLDRWRYGRQLLDAKAGRKQLPHGLLDNLIKAAEKTGITLTKVEIQRRIRCAEAYDIEAKVRRSATHFGGWWALVTADFPHVDHDGSDLDDLLDTEGLGDAPETFEQFQLDIPGLKPVITAHGRKVPVVKGVDGATVADVAAYVDMCEQQHESRGKTLEKARESLQTMREGCDGDETANAVEAWEAGIDDSADTDDRAVDRAVPVMV